MHVVYYGSFVFLLLYLFVWSFKKGEEFRSEWDIYKRTSFRGIVNRWYYLRIWFKSLFSLRHRYIKKELKKPYNEEVSPNAIEALSHKRNINAVLDEVNAVFEYKDWVQFKKFDFDNQQGISRRVQFFPIRIETANMRRNTIKRIFQFMLENNRLIEEEKVWWEAYLTVHEIVDKDFFKKEPENTRSVFDLDTEEPFEETIIRKVDIKNRKQF